MAGGTAAASAAAAEAARRQREEEECLTMYKDNELDQEWEFKIVRSSMGSFRNPEKFQQLLAEEAQAGWEFLEKFDNSRVRFKRLRSAERSDSFAHIDPYRTNFGMSDGALALVIIVGIFGSMALVGFLIMLLNFRR